VNVEGWRRIELDGDDGEAMAAARQDRPAQRAVALGGEVALAPPTSRCTDLALRLVK
jgi:hypothetical protein